MAFLTSKTTYGLLVSLALTVLLPSIRAASCYATLNRTSFSNCTQLDPRYALHWEVRDSEIVFGLQVDVNITNNWFGLGLSASGGMVGASLYVLTAGQNTGSNSTIEGDVKVSRYWATEFAYPNSVAQPDQHVQLVPSLTVITSNSTTVVFKRPIDTCDEHDNEIRHNRVQAVIWAIGETPYLSYHGPNNRGSQYIEFWKDDGAVSPPLPKDTQTYEIRFDRQLVPRNTTNYICTHKRLALPSNATKYHLIRSAAVKTQATLHHMILYGCRDPPATLDDSYECFNVEPNCNTFVIGFAPGVDVVEMPPEAAIPVGEDGFRYFSLQAHYNNANNSDGIYDSSGFNISVTTQLRPNDMAVLTLGTQNITVPPHTPMWTTPGGVCYSNCTGRLTQNVTLYGAFLHMHGLGRNMSTRHVRNGKELEPFASIKYYDYQFQSLALPPPQSANWSFVGRTLMPGDTLITQCTYDSTKRQTDNYTNFGLSTSDEMCFDFVLYYPRVSWFETCYDAGPVSTCGTGYDLEIAFEKAENATSTQAAEQIFGQYVESGLLIPNEPISFTPYKATCTPIAPNRSMRSVKRSIEPAKKASSNAAGVGGAVALMLMVSAFGFM